MREEIAYGEYEYARRALSNPVYARRNVYHDQVDTSCKASKYDVNISKISECKMTVGDIETDKENIVRDRNECSVQPSNEEDLESGKAMIPKWETQLELGTLKEIRSQLTQSSRLTNGNKGSSRDSNTGLHVFPSGYVRHNSVSDTWDVLIRPLSTGEDGNSTCDDSSFSSMLETLELAKTDDWIVELLEYDKSSDDCTATSVVARIRRNKSQSPNSNLSPPPRLLEIILERIELFYVFSRLAYFCQNSTISSSSSYYPMIFRSGTMVNLVPLLKRNSPSADAGLPVEELPVVDIQNICNACALYCRWSVTIMSYRNVTSSIIQALFRPWDKISVDLVESCLRSPDPSSPFATRISPKRKVSSKKIPSAIKQIQGLYAPRQTSRKNEIQQLFALDFDVVSFAKNEKNAERPKRSLKSVVRFVAESSSESNTSLKRKRSFIGEGFECPQCYRLCRYDMTQCPGCELKCRYVAGTGVVVYRDRSSVIQSSVSDGLIGIQKKRLHSDSKYLESHLVTPECHLTTDYKKRDLDSIFSMPPFDKPDTDTRINSEKKVQANDSITLVSQVETPDLIENQEKETKIDSLASQLDTPSKRNRSLKVANMPDLINNQIGETKTDSLALQLDTTSVLKKAKQKEKHPFECEICFKRLPNSVSHSYHRYYYHHLKKNMFGCRYCFSVYSTSIARLNHMQENHPNMPTHSREMTARDKRKKEMPLVHHCTICFKGKPDSYAIKRHLRRSHHTDNIRVKYFCPFCKPCEYVVYDLEKFKKHVAENHKKCVLIEATVTKDKVKVPKDKVKEPKDKVKVPKGKVKVPKLGSADDPIQDSLHFAKHHNVCLPVNAVVEKYETKNGSARGTRLKYQLWSPLIPKFASFLSSPPKTNKYEPKLSFLIDLLQIEIKNLEKSCTKLSNEQYLLESRSYKRTLRNRTLEIEHEQMQKAIVGREHQMLHLIQSHTNRNKHRNFYQMEMDRIVTRPVKFVGSKSEDKFTVCIHPDCSCCHPPKNDEQNASDIPFPLFRKITMDGNPWSCPTNEEKPKRLVAYSGRTTSKKTGVRSLDEDCEKLWNLHDVKNNLLFMQSYNQGLFGEIDSRSSKRGKTKNLCLMTR